MRAGVCGLTCGIVHSWQEDEQEGEQEDEPVGEEEVDTLLASLDKEMGAAVGVDGRRHPSPSLECARLRAEIEEEAVSGDPTPPANIPYLKLGAVYTTWQDVDFAVRQHGVVK